MSEYALEYTVAGIVGVFLLLVSIGGVYSLGHKAGVAAGQVSLQEDLACRKFGEYVFSKETGQIKFTLFWAEDIRGRGYDAGEKHGLNQGVIKAFNFLHRQEPIPKETRERYIKRFKLETDEDYLEH